MTKDPVCGMKVEENDAQAEAHFAGKKYYFCSDDCRKQFEQHPENYIENAA